RKTGEGGGLPFQCRPFRKDGCCHRTQAFVAVVLENGGHHPACSQVGDGRCNPALPAQVQKHVPQLDGKCPGLVYFQTALVGTSNSCLLSSQRGICRCQE